MEGRSQRPLGLVWRKLKQAAGDEAGTAGWFDAQTPRLLELELEVFEDADSALQCASDTENVVNVDAYG